MDNKEIKILECLINLGYKYISKDTDGDMTAWEDKPSLEEGTHGTGIWLTPNSSGFAYGSTIDQLSKYVEPGGCKTTLEILHDA